MSTEESSPPQSPPSPPPTPPPPRRLPVGATLLPSDSDFVVMTEIVIEEGDLQHDLIKERSAYAEHPSVLLSSDTPAVRLRRQHVFIGTRQKQMKSLNEITFSRLVGELGHWKQAGGKMDVENDQGVVTGWVCVYDFYESRYTGDKTGEHTCYRMKEYNSNKYMFNEKCIYTLEYLDKNRKEKLAVFERGLNTFSDCDSKPKAAAAAKKYVKATRNEKGKEKLVEENESVTEAITLAEGRVTRSQARHVKASPMFSVIPKKPRGRPGVISAKNVFDSMIGGEQMYPLLESLLFELLKARGVEVGEGSGLVKEGIVEGAQNVRCDKEEEGATTVLSKPADKEEEGACGVLRSDKETDVILIDSDSEDDESGPEKLNDKCGSAKD